MGVEHLRITGPLVADPTWRFGIVASRFNHVVVERLVAGALEHLHRAGVPASQIVEVWVPGAWETPITCRALADAKKVDAIIACGAVIRGATGHYEHVAGGVSSGIAQVALASGIPITNAVLTVDTLEQALDRAGGKAGNKGAGAAAAAIELLGVIRQVHS